MHPLAVTLFGVRLDNPVTPWVMLGLVSATWLILYLWLTQERDG